ncbi:hypothetical protein [Salinimicrobium sp. GXAS 041]|uniref:hypothetical protein n=1 Tax=Salinimicrobium sp. GXAS 041 TaxID=3400806 RepID=UPI003C768F0C
MIGKAHFLYLLFAIFFLPISSFGQACPTSVSIKSTPGTVICEGESVEFSASTSVGTNLTFSWKVNNQFSGSGKTVTIPALQDGDLVEVEVSSKDAPGCLKTDEVRIQVNPNISGIAKIKAGNTKICPGETVNFSIDFMTHPGSNANYKWQLTRNGTTSIVSTSNNLSDNIFKEGDKIKLVIDPSLPCFPAFESNSIVITENSGPPATPGIISGGTSVCPGSSVTYTISEVAEANEYIWMLPTGWTGISSTNSITVTPGKVGGTITVKAKNSCGTSAPQSLEVTSRTGTPNTPNAVEGPVKICPNTTVTYEVPPVDGAKEYFWKLPPDWTGSSTTNTITVTTGAQGSRIIEVQAGNDCGQSKFSSLEVLVEAGTPAIPEPINGPHEICAGANGTYSIPEVPGATEYEWTLPQGWTGISNTNSIDVTTTSNNGEIAVIAKNNCGSSASRKLEVTIAPGISTNPVEIRGNTSVCAGESTTYSVSRVSGATYNWSIPNGWNIVQENGNEIIIVAGNEAENDILEVLIKDQCGNSLSRSVSLSINPGKPVISGIIAGPQQVCSGKNEIYYSISAVESATNYTWNFPTGWQLINGMGTNVVSVIPAARGGEVSVVAENGCGKSNRSIFTVEVENAVPSQPDKIFTNLSEDLNICNSEAEITFSVPPVPNATAYHWTFPEGWNVIAGEGTNSVVITADKYYEYSNPMSVTVEAVNSCGNSAPRILENVVCERNFEEQVNGGLKVIYVSRDRQILIDNPKMRKIKLVLLHNSAGQETETYLNIDTMKRIVLPVRYANPGSYFVRIHFEEGVLTKQIMLN